jgi:hypothetical protein
LSSIWKKKKESWDERDEPINLYGNETHPIKISTKLRQHRLVTKVKTLSIPTILPRFPDKMDEATK